MLLVLMGISLFFSLIFHLGTKEPPSKLHKRTSTTTNAGDVKLRCTDCGSCRCHFAVQTVTNKQRPHQKNNQTNKTKDIIMIVLLETDRHQFVRIMHWI